jgi:hypothetical protein
VLQSRCNWRYEVSRPHPDISPALAQLLTEPIAYGPVIAARGTVACYLEQRGIDGWYALAPDAVERAAEVATVAELQARLEEQ